MKPPPRSKRAGSASATDVIDPCPLLTDAVRPATGKRIAGIAGLLLAGVAVYYLVGSFVSGVREAGSLSNLLSFNPFHYFFK